MLIVLLNQWSLCRDNEDQSPDMREVIINTVNVFKIRHIKTRYVKITHIQHLTYSSLPTPSCPNSISLNRWHIYMHHHSEKDEFEPHGLLFLLYIKENSRINPFVFTHLFLHILTFKYLFSVSLHLKLMIIIKGKIKRAWDRFAFD